MDVNRKIAGLPMWGWGIGLGGGLLLGYYLRTHRRVKSESVVTETPAPVPVGATSSYEGLISEGSGLPGSPGFVGATGNFEGIISREFESTARQFHEELESSRGILKAEVEETLRRAHEELRAAEPVHTSGEQTSPIQVIVGSQGSQPIQGGGPPTSTVKVPRPPATPPKPETVVRNGVNIELLEEALRYANDPQYHFPNHRRETLADLIRAHPGWGPMTIANCGRVRGHSTRA